jgi:hypothetical protein
VSFLAQFMSFVCKEKKKENSATVCKLRPKLRARFSFNGGITSVRNTVKELGFSWE